MLPALLLIAIFLTSQRPEGYIRSAFLAVSSMADNCAVPLVVEDRGVDPFCELTLNGSRVCLPRLWLIGASKSATSSLALHLAGNPHVQLRCGNTHKHPPVPVEPVWLRLNGTLYSSCRGTREVQLYNHVADSAVRLESERNMSVLMWGEADTSLEYTPDYLYHPAVAKRVHLTFQQLSAAALGPVPAPLTERLRFVVMLREPVSRTVSSFWAKGGRTVSEAIETFDMLIDDYRRQKACLARNISALECGSDGRGGAWTPHDHLSKSVYAPQLARWFRVFSPCQFFVTTMERFYLRGVVARGAAYDALLRWAGLPTDSLTSIKRDELLGTRMNPTKNPQRQPLPTSYQLKLQRFFEPHNHELARLLGLTILHDWYGPPPSPRGVDDPPPPALAPSFVES
jgi:hypothetical protein